MTDYREMNEQELREAPAPRPKTASELIAVIDSLTDRQQDYGTCVYAMSLSAVAALNYVAHRLGVTGFQVSCADLEILRHTRNLEWGKVLDYSNLLYPQYCDEEHYPSVEKLLDDNREELAKRAAVLLAESSLAAGRVVEHWERLVAAGSVGEG